jgi:hypothetical protein
MAVAGEHDDQGDGDERATPDQRGKAIDVS